MTWINRVGNVLQSRVSQGGIAPMNGATRMASVAFAKRHNSSEVTPGCRVRVCRGVLCGTEGMVIGHASDSRVIIAVDLAETGVSIEVAASQVEPLYNGNHH